MNRTDKLRVIRKLTMLVILLVGFIVASSDVAVRQTLARPCCSQCEETDAYCGTLPEPDSTTCFNDNFRYCWRWCSFSC
jgi:hypothetical protein